MFLFSFTHFFRLALNCFFFFLTDEMSNCILACPRYAVDMREAKKVKRIFRFAVPAERQNPRLVLCEFKTKLGKPLFQHLINSAGFVFILKHDYKVVCVFYQVCFSSESLFDSFLKPQIQYIVQVHICQHRRYQPSLRVPTLASS